MALRQAVVLLRSPRTGPILIASLHLVALALFVHGFLLTRVHLPQRGSPQTPTGASAAPPPYDRVVWLMVDALRYDFVVADGRYTCRGTDACHQGRMPFLSALSQRQGAAAAFMFVAEAPTTTTQRLKSLATGSLPSFFDVSNSFSAGAVPDDNLLQQLAGAGKQLAFLGDTTWQQLFPDAWAWSRPYPCFNVRDLHTVDDGVWQHLLPALAAPATWDGLLIAHYLGVDHCGHSHGVGSPEMVAKLGQMDEHVRQVVAALVQGAGPGGPYARTLLLVAGDHGQTLGGDHGGGSPEEVDSALVAVDIAALRLLQQGQGGGAARGWAGGLAACRANCSCGTERNQCAPDLRQVDLTPTLSAMLGVPIPFGNLGKLNGELWRLAAARQGDGDADAQAAWERSLADALLDNAQQVHAYINTYAATPGTSFSRPALARLNSLYAAVRDQAAAAQDPAVTASRCHAFLDAAAEVAREQWTQFRGLPMLLGLALFAATLALQAAAAFSGGQGSLWQQARSWQLVSRWRAGRLLLLPTFRGWLAALALVHGLGMFSFFYLLAEGKMVCYLVAAACAALALSTGAAAWAAGQRVRGTVALGVMSLRCNALMALLGLAHHTGQGFWARLTMHDVQPADDVQRGWPDKLASAKALAAMLMAHSGLDQLPPTALAAAQHSLLCTLPLAALLLLSSRLLSNAGGTGRRLPRLLLVAAYASAAAYLQLEQAGKQGLLPADISLQQLLSKHTPAGLASHIWPAVAAVVQPLMLAWPAAGELGGSLAALPLQALLPHATYALCGTLAAVWLLRVATRQLRGAAAAVSAAQLVLAATAQVSDRCTPLILLLGLLELAAIAQLMGRRAQLAPAGIGVTGVAREAAALTALVATQMFYATGHLCEFAGLQYTAGFIGSQEFHLWRSGTLVALNTFGGMLAALLALPVVLQHVQAAAAVRQEGTAIQPNGGTALKAEAEPAAVHPASANSAAALASLHTTLLVAGLVRATAAFCATLGAGLQRRHLYAWALFAPKFAFEASFLLLTDAALVLLAFLA